MSHEEVDLETEDNTKVESSNEGNEKEKTEEDEAELEALKKKVKEMEEEEEKLRRMQDELETSTDSGANKEDIDSRSVYIGNVDYSTTPEELQAHFHSCGTINRVTILCDKFTGHPKGFAYIEFADKDSIANAVLMNETLFKGRQIKVTAKRTNVPGMGRGVPQRGGAIRGYYGYRPYYAPRGRGFRGRRAFFAPY